MIKTKSKTGSENRYDVNPLALTGICLVILASYAVLALLQDLRIRVPEMIALCAWLTVMLAAVCWYCESRQRDLGLITVLTTALLIRLLFLPHPPQLSDDVFRYILDGRMVLSGIGPYRFSPAEIAASMPDLVEIASRVNHPQYITLYPPAAQLVFAAGALFGGILGMKLVLVLLDLAACALILGILTHLGLPRCRAILYAWHPLAVLEVAGSGHIDAAAVFFTASAIFLAVRASRSMSKNIESPFAPVLSGTAAAAAGLTKLLPLVFLPAIFIALPRKHRASFLWSAAGAFVLISVPFWPELQSSIQTLGIYLGNWEFSGFLFRMMRTLTGSGSAARMLLLMAFSTLAAWFYANLCRIRSKGLGIHVAHCLSATCYALSIAWLVMTPTLHPWYGLYLLFFLPFAAGPAGIVLSFSVLLGYRVVIGYAMTGLWMENNLITALILLGPAAAAAASLLLRSSGVATRSEKLAVL